MTTALRTPGVRFTVVPPAPPSTLPRMDIAGFVGFAASGPVNTPVAIEDRDAFAALFGADLLLARDPRTTSDVYANLGPAVRAFFANGGRRCWIVRVARDPETTPFPVPGLMIRSGTTVAAAALWARSAGPWADGLSVAAALQSEVVATDRADLSAQPPWVELAAPSDVAPGDLLRLTVGGQSCLAVVSEALMAAPGAATITAWLDPASVLYMDVPTPSMITAGSSADFTTPDYAERLTFDLYTRDSGGTITSLLGLGFAAPHPRYVGLLPTDEQLFSIPAADEGAVPALWGEVTTPRWPLAAQPGLDSPVFYPIGMDVTASTWSRGTPSASDPLTRGGLAHFDSGLFIDEALRTVQTTAWVGADGGMAAALLDTADYIRYTGPNPRALTGVDALLEIDEVTLICAPDSVQRGWAFSTRSQPLSVESSASAESGSGAFKACADVALSPPVLAVEQTADPGAFTLTWTATDAASAVYVLEQSISRSFAEVSTFYRGPETSVVVHELGGALDPGAGSWFRVQAMSGGSESGWSNAVGVATGPQEWAEIVPVEEYSDFDLIEVQRALLRVAAARGEMFATLALPAHYTEAETLAHVARLQTVSTGPAATAVPPIDPLSEARTLSFGALYHPWVFWLDPTGASLSLPPDGPAMAVMASVAADSGAWIAPANVPLTGALALTPSLDRTMLPPGAVARINVLSQEPIGFVALSAWTLSLDPDLTDISVRRLLSLLRRTALLWGPNHVFDPNDAYLVNSVTRDFEAVLEQLYVRGAFTGDTPEQTWFLHVLSGSDPTSGLDIADLVVEIGVAPSRPMRFLTVRLAQSASGSASVGGT